MNIDVIKCDVKDLVGKTVSLKINIGRNRFDTILGVVEAVYPYLFTVKVVDELKTFSYVDLLTKNVVISVV